MRRVARRSTETLPVLRTTIRLAGMLTFLGILIGFVLPSLQTRSTPFPPDTEPPGVKSSRTAADGEPRPEADRSAAPGSVESPPALPSPRDERDPAEAPAIQPLLDAVTDKSPLSNPEMPAYWKLMSWSLSQNYSDLARRARHQPVFTRFWDDADACRGKPFHLRLHIRRILDYEAPRNSANVQRVYEFWGFTEESRSYPYVVVCPELPHGMKVAADTQVEGEFVGYFLKTMAYSAHDRLLAAPLLVGQMRPVAVRQRIVPPGGISSGRWRWFAAAGVAGMFAWSAWSFIARSRRRRPSPERNPGDEAHLAWLQSESEAIPRHESPDNSPGPSIAESVAAQRSV